ncbi:MAG: AlbA family DNA-binding domain-containing protein [Thermoleophilia bacterium]
MSGARTLFDQLLEGGLELIQRTVSEAWHESPVLDFKTLDKDSAPLTKNGRRTLAEALSGFANSDGGVIVWGIDARRGRHLEPDVARELRPIDRLQLLLSDLHGLTLNWSPQASRAWSIMPLPRLRGSTWDSS